MKYGALRYKNNRERSYVSRVWTYKEIEYLRENYTKKTDYELAVILHRSERAIKAFRLRMKMKRDKRSAHEEYNGCDQNCFECKYSDCIIPYGALKNYLDSCEDNDDTGAD